MSEETKHSGNTARGFLYVLAMIVVIVAALAFWLNQRARTSGITQQVHQAVEGSELSLEYVEVLGGEVILSGQIVSPTERDDAIRILAAVPGVEKITDNRELQRTRQATLTIRAFGGTVNIQGQLPDQASVDALLAGIRGAYGNAAIANQLKPSDTTISASWIGELGVLLESLAAVEPLEFNIGRDQVSVSGTARGKKTRNALDRELRRIFGNEFLVVNEVVLPTRVEMAELQFRRSLSDISLQGVFPNQAMIDRIVATVRAHFPGAQIRYDLALNSDASEPGWLEGTLAILEALAVADPASIEVSNRGLELTGRVTSVSTKADLKSLVRDAYSDPIPVSTRIRVSEPAESSLLVVRIANGDVVLEGTLPGRRFETEVLATADVTFGPERVTNLLRVDDKVRDPDWLGSALVQIAQLKSKPNALLTASDTGIDFEITQAPAPTAGKGPDTISSKGQVRMVLIEETIDTTSATTTNPATTTPVASESPPPAAEDDSITASPAPAPESPAGSDPLATETAMTLQKSLSALDVSAVQFAPNSAELTDEAEKVLNEVAAILTSHAAGVVEIGGHTDSQGSETYNLRLSEQRANSVASYLVAGGIPGDRLAARGYGERLPVADNDTAEGRTRNRRIEFKIVN